MSEENLEYVNLWGTWDYFSNVRSFFMCWIGSFTTQTYINEFIFKESIPNLSIFLFSLGPPLLFCIYYSQRNKRVIDLLSSDNETLHKRSYFGPKYNILLLFFFVIWIATEWFFTLFKIESPTMAFLLSLTLFLAPYVDMYDKCLTENGAINIELENLMKYKDDYKKEQYWLAALSKRIRDILRVGKVEVSVTTLIHHFNLELSKSDTVVNNFDALKDSFLNEKQGYSIVRMVSGMLPNSELKVYHRLSFLDNIIGKRYLEILIAMIALLPTILNLIQII